MELNIEALLLDSMPPDEEMVDLIEQAFLERQIDGANADLRENRSLKPNSFVGLKKNGRSIY